MSTTAELPTNETLRRELLAEYVALVKRLAADEFVDAEEVRRAISGVGVGLEALETDVARLRRRMVAAAEIQSVAKNHGEARDLENEVRRLNEQISRERAECERKLAPTLQKVIELNRRAASLQASSAGAAQHALRSGASPAIDNEIRLLRDHVTHLNSEALELRRRLPQLKERADVAPLVREQFDEFRETGQYYQRKDGKGREVSGLWLGSDKPPAGVRLDLITDGAVITRCERRVQELERAAAAVESIELRLTTEIPNKVREIEAQIDRLATAQLDPLNMDFAGVSMS